MKDIIKGIVKRYIPVAIGLLVVLLSFLITNARVNTARDNISSQQRELNDIKNQLEIQRIAKDASEKKLIQDTTGLDVNRVNSDNDIAKEFVSMIFTWDSSKDYDSIRLSMVNDYGISADSDMLTVLFPEDVKVVQPDGSVLSYIDTHGRNCQFEKMDTYVAGINVGVYSYFAFVTWSSSDSDGNEAMSTAVLTYDIDSDGNFSNVNGYTIAR